MTTPLDPQALIKELRQCAAQWASGQPPWLAEVTAASLLRDADAIADVLAQLVAARDEALRRVEGVNAEANRQWRRALAAEALAQGPDVEELMAARTEIMKLQAILELFGLNVRAPIDAVAQAAADLVEDQRSLNAQRLDLIVKLQAEHESHVETAQILRRIQARADAQATEILQLKQTLAETQNWLKFACADRDAALLVVAALDSVESTPTPSTCCPGCGDPTTQEMCAACIAQDDAAMRLGIDTADYEAGANAAAERIAVWLRTCNQAVPYPELCAAIAASIRAGAWCRKPAS